MTCICTQCRGAIADPFAKQGRTRIQRALLLTAGWFLIGVAMVGWILPLLPGYVFFLLGLLVLSSEYVWAEKLVQKVRRRFPRVSSRMDGFAHSMTLRWNAVFS